MSLNTLKWHENQRRRMEHDDAKWLRVLDFQERLKTIVKETEPPNWPHAKWIYEELSKVIMSAVDDDK